jgi:hypothetical protein
MLACFYILTFLESLFELNFGFGMIAFCTIDSPTLKKSRRKKYKTNGLGKGRVLLLLLAAMRSYAQQSLRDWLEQEYI